MFIGSEDFLSPPKPRRGGMILDGSAIPPLRGLALSLTKSCAINILPAGFPRAPTTWTPHHSP
jgi:hypothetical protein